MLQTAISHSSEALSGLSRFFSSGTETQRSLAELGLLSPAYRAVMVSDGTLTHMLSAMYLEEIRTDCLENGEAMPGEDQRRWLDIGAEPCVRRYVELTGATSRVTYVRATSYLYPPRLPASFLDELDQPGASLGAQLLESRISHRRELIKVRTDAGLVFSRLYRILLHDRPAILIQEDFMEQAGPGGTLRETALTTRP